MTAPYSRVYWSVMDDPKFEGVRDDMKLMGSWLTLLIVADMAHPASAFLPPTVPKSAITDLSDCGLIDLLPGFRYRVHGLDAERGRRSEAAAVGGFASGRSRAREHSLNGRSPAPRTKTNLDETRLDKTRQDEKRVPARELTLDEEKEAVADKLARRLGVPR